MIPISYYIVLSSLLFSLGLVGIVINRKNIIMILLCVELLLLAVNTNFIAFSHFWQNVSGQIFVFFILTVAAVEAAIGLAIILLLFRKQGNIDADNIHALKE